MTEKWTNYTPAGYDLADGLGKGRWVVVPNTGGLVRWVGEIEMPKSQRTGPRMGACLNCAAIVDKRALRCRRCAQLEAKRIKREHAKRVRSESAA